MRSFRFHFAAAVILLTSVCAMAQINVNEEQGIKPYDSLHGGDLDSVSLTNGSLLLHIPLACFPQRGSLNLCFEVYSNTKQWQAVSYCIPDLGDPTGWDCSHTKWEPLPRGGLLPVGGLLTGDLIQNPPNYSVDGAYVASSVDYWFQSFLQTEPIDPNNPPNQTIYDWAQNIVSPDGNVHQLADASGGSIYRGPTYPLRSMDPVGMLVPDGQTLILPNGTRLSYVNGLTPQKLNTAPSSITDANGNQITINSSSGAYSDTMGRVIPAPPGTTTSDLTHCPTGTTSAKVWTVPGVAGVNGGTRTFKFCYSNFTIFTNFQQSGVTEYPSTSTSLLSAIVLPDFTLWTLSYDNYGSVTELEFPTGGSISYTYNQATQAIGFSLAVTSRIVNANDGTGGHTWTYTYSGQLSGNPANYSGKTVVTSPDGNDTVHTIANVVSGMYCSLYDTQAQYYQGSQSTGTLLKTVATQYSGIAIPSNLTSYAVVPVQVTTTWPSGHTAKVVNTWDSGITENPYGPGGGGAMTVLLGSLLEKDEYDFSNNLARSTLSHHLWQDNSTYLTNNLLGPLVSTTICTQQTNCIDGTQQNRVAQTTYGTDEVAVVSSGITTGLVLPPAGGNIRGNPTTVSHWLNGTNFISSTATYFDTGMKATSTDPLSHTNNYTYSSTFAGAYMTQTKLPDTGTPAVHHVISGGYDFNTGLLTSFTDENSQAYTYAYDIMLRLTQGNHPDGGQTKFTYPDANTVQRQRLIAGTTYDFFQAKFDGVGRTYQTQMATPDCSGNIKVDTTYDVVGRVATASNPYCSTTDPTYGVTTNQYDALGRTTQVTKPDGSKTLASYTGPAVRTQDEGNGTSRTTRVAQSDALGRLVNICEVTGATQAGGNTPAACNLAIAATGFLTTYSYDTLNNLTGIQQAAVTRSFTYDNLSRLLSATNPESGTTSYTYDNNSNVQSRIRPAPNQGNPSNHITTTYSYDVLNRLTQVTYSDSVTPTVTTNYDTTSELGITLTNTIGRVSAEYTKDAQGHVLSGEVFSYDSMGRVKDNSQCTPQNCPNGVAFPVSYSYDLLGDVLTSTNGTGVTFSYTYDAAARLSTMTSSLQDSNHPATMLSGLQYNSLGSLTASSAGALNESFKFDCRGRILGYASAIAPATPSQSLANTAGCPNTSAMNTAPAPFGATGSAFFLSSLVNPAPSSDSILLSGTAARSSDHGLVKVTLPAPNPILRSEEIQVFYHEGETALTVARRLAKQINERRSSRLRASLRPMGSGAILDLTISSSDPWNRTQPSLRVSVSSNRKIPSIRASDLAPPGATPSSAGGFQSTWMEGQ